MRVTHGLALVLCQSCLSVGTASVSESARARVPRSPTPEPLQGDLGFHDLVELDLTEAEALQDRDVRPSDIHDIRLADVVLTATKPDAADLAFLERVELWASAPGLPPVLIASQDDFPPGVPEIAFDLEDVDLEDYVLSRALTLSLEASGETPSKSTTLEVDFTVDVGITASGACRNL